LILFYAFFIYLGQASSLMPDYAKAKVSAVKIFELLDRITKIDNWSSTYGKILDKTALEGEITFESVEFSYPTRYTN
jgi:ABC-type multidrug transport system fused ATPase/permease subunit